MSYKGKLGLLEYYCWLAITRMSRVTLREEASVEKLFLYFVSFACYRKEGESR